MEKFQMLFPYSETDLSSMSSVLMTNNFEAGDHHNFLGLNNNIYNDPSSILLPNNNDNNDQMISSESASMEVESSDDHHQQMNNKGTTKKGDQKKIRKARYAFQTRSQVDILDDGYRWRKYGQKAVKNNKFPRSYYRCTHQGCNVKKQVQRLTKDEGVVVTTYEGTHSHPIHTPTDNFDHILKQMQIYTPF
ncbi:WRKY DNA-binding protein 75 [Euphorbia peplus]|nr:WRKY DNA-binding protein 75 [Euphorbia peplus]